MGNHPSAVADDGQSSIHRQSYTVRGPLYARAITASTINATTVHARRITCQSAQICAHQPLAPQNYPNPPHRSITAHTISADVIYADEINCKTLRCYDVFVGEGEQWRAKRTQWQDRQAVWDGKEDVASEPSDNESDEEHTRNEERASRKNMVKMGVAGALAVGIGGAAFAYFKHKQGGGGGKEEEHRDDREKEELRRRQEDDDRRRREEDDRRKRDDEERRRREQRLHEQHQVLPTFSSGSGPVRGNYHLSSRNARLWSDGNHCFLIAECDSGGGRFQESRIDLDEIITNSDGEFRWVNRGQTGNFSGTAQRWEMVDGNAIAAELQRVNRSWQRRTLDLGEFIKNDNGQLRYIR
jgi:hypothetical protein